MAKKVEDYLEYSHEKDWLFMLTEPPFPTQEQDLEQAKKIRQKLKRHSNRCLIVQPADTDWIGMK